MIDASHWTLRGCVLSLRSEIAEWDAAADDWQRASFFQFVAFDRDRRVVQLDQRGREDSVFRTTYNYDADGRLRETQAGTADAPIMHRVVHTSDETGRPLAVTETGEDGVEHTTHTSSYDDKGRRTTVHVLPPALGDTAMTFGIEGSALGYGAPGATTITTRYDERDLSREALFQDASGAVIRRIVLVRDGDGRVVTEEAENVAPLALPEGPEMSADDREQLLALARLAFATMRTTYEYDAEGRLVSRTQRMGLLAEDRTAYSYDERGNAIEEFTASVNRDMNLDAEGRPQTGADTTRWHDIRLAYEYDGRGNWKARIVRNRFTKDAEFEPSNVEWRTIEYYDS